MKEDNLWLRLSDVSFDDLDAVFPFTRRLARDNRWTHDYARRVVEEYRRFAYLAMVAGHEVTPSDEVDQAWHLHLTYTRHYWGEFTDVLGGPLHHGPTKGGPSEAQRFSENYDNTLCSYERFFGEKPPQDIWPSSEDRFGLAPYMARVNTKRNIVIPRHKIHAVGAGIATLFAGGFLTVGTASAQAEGSQSFLDLLREIPIIAWVGLVVAVVLIFFVAASQGGKSGKSSSEGGAGYAGDGSGGKSSGCGTDGGSGCGGSGCGGCGG